MGRVVAERIAGRAAHFPPILGSFALRIGELVVATTGLTATAARAAGLTPAVAWGSFPDRAVLDPERKYDAVALVSEAGTGRLLGLQAVGPGAAVRRADVLATQLRRGAYLDDLFDLEPCCHPATGDLLDPLPHLAALAVAEATGGPRAVATEWAAGDALLLDVREVSEMDGERPPIPGALNIPLGALADRCGEIPRDRPVVVYCARGPRSFEAVSLLLSKEFFNIFYLAGGVGLRQSR
jgi:rhodanese-related sulfurtransferase